jgi:hypothetical protein
MDAPNILIATPAYGGNVKLQFLNSLLQTQDLFGRKRIRHAFLGAANAEIVAARNFLASFMMERQEFTHLLFVDSDMAFAPAAVERLLSADKPLIGCICPRRKIDLDAFARLSGKGASQAVATAGALDFVVRYTPGTKNVEIANGLASVLGVGMALTLIQRSVFSAFLETGKIARYERHSFTPEGLQGPMHGFFDPIQDSAAGHVSEDFSFCERYVKNCGGEVWALASEVVHHVGDFSFAGSYLDHLAARRL